MTTFNDFSLAAPILKALGEESHVTPTPIQAQAIPPVMAGRDLLGIAQTGTGKTAAFALPILDRLARATARPAPRTCRVLVLSPTRELSNQTDERFAAYGRHLRLSTTVVIGGVPIGRQMRALAPGVDVLVATPGRLLDLIGERALSLDAVEVFVLDEADQMLDMGFIHDIRKIVAKLPKARQNLFFSATMPTAIASLAGDLLRDPAKVAVTPVAKTADRVEQQVMFVDQAAKGGALAALLADPAFDRALVFTRTKHGADKVVRGLARYGIAAQAIHGNKSQPQRERTLAAFRQGDIRVLVATDIAARGIDVEAISHVVNYDLPNVPESYVHRIGRTARAGAGGIAISLCDREERPYLRDIEKLIRQPIPVAAAPAGVPVAAVAAEEPARLAAPPHRPGNPRAGRPHGHRPMQGNGGHGGKGAGANGKGGGKPAASGAADRPGKGGVPSWYRPSNRGENRA